MIWGWAANNGAPKWSVFYLELNDFVGPFTPQSSSIAECGGDATALNMSTREVLNFSKLNERNVSFLRTTGSGKKW